MRADNDSRLVNEFVRSFLRRYAPQRLPTKANGIVAVCLTCEIESGYADTTPHMHIGTNQAAKKGVVHLPGS